MSKAKKEFCSLFEELPNISLLHIYSTDSLQINDILKEIANLHNGKLISKKFSLDDCKKLRAKSRDFEYIVLSNVLKECQNIKLFLIQVYHLLENSAFLIIIEDDKTLKTQLLQLLDQCNYLAPNDIDIFDDKLLIIAKKMHMWDGGL